MHIWRSHFSYFYSKLFVSTGITAFYVFPLFNLFSKLFKIIHYFCVSVHNLHTTFALKLDRITRSIYDWENLMTFLDENDAYLDCANDDVNTSTANGRLNIFQAKFHLVIIGIKIRH